MKRAVQIAGSHTDVGKTYVACALLRAARAAGRSVGVFKPVVSGFDPAAAADSDPGRLIVAAGLVLDAASLDAVSPLRFSTPIAPPLAAAREGVSLTLADLVRRSKAWLQGSADFGLIETAGGVMSPLAEDGLCLHLMAALPLPAILVGGSYLGAISHTLTALAALHEAGIPVKAVVVSQDADPAAPDFGDTVETIRRWADPVVVVAAPRGSEDWAASLI